MLSPLGGCTVNRNDTMAKQALAPIWKSAGLHLTRRNSEGWLMVTPDLMRAYYTRPEIHPVDESCDNEHRLFEKLMGDPFATVQPAELEAIADADAAENYRLILQYRDFLVAQGSVEAAYMALFSSGEVPRIPPVFIEQLAHLITANILSGETDAFMARAGELFFRDQKASTGEGMLVLADAEVVEMVAENGGFGGLGALLAEAGTPMREVSLDILTEDNAPEYFTRADRFDMALDFRFTQPGADAFARMIERWVRHFWQVKTRVQAMQSIRDEKWTWHVGLDAESTAILNALYQGETPDTDRMMHVAGLFRMEFLNRNDLVETMRGKPVYLGIAMNDQSLIRMKPQNLLVNLPLKRASS